MRVHRATAPSDLSWRWHHRIVRLDDVAGAIVVLIPLLLGAYLMTQSSLLEFGMYGICILAVTPCIGPFMASLPRHPANLTLVLLFSALAISTLYALADNPPDDSWLRAKALAATAAWVSIYIVVVSAVRTRDAVLRLTKWIVVTGAILSASVYAGAFLHLGEVVIDRAGRMRAFGPLGDQVAFVLVLPALVSFVSGRLVLFAIHLGALFLTGTRGAAGCLVIGILVYFALVLTGRVSARKGRLASASAAVAVGFILWLTPVSTVLMERLLEPTFRTQAFGLGLQVVRENPFLGVGFNGFDKSRSAVFEDWVLPSQAVNGLSRVSNQYIQTATDGGLPALLLLILFTVCSVRNALYVIGHSRSTPELFGCQLWLISMLIGNQTSLWLLSSTASGFFTFAVAGIAARTRTVLRKDQGKNTREATWVRR